MENKIDLENEKHWIVSELDMVGCIEKSFVEDCKFVEMIATIEQSNLCDISRRIPFKTI